jgi:hypothetical protein
VHRKLAAKNAAKVGLVDCDRNTAFCQEMGIEAYPTLRWWRGGRRRGSSSSSSSSPADPVGGHTIGRGFNLGAGTLLELWCDRPSSAQIMFHDDVLPTSRRSHILGWLRSACDDAYLRS